MKKYSKAIISSILIIILPLLFLASMYCVRKVIHKFNWHFERYCISAEHSNYDFDYSWAASSPGFIAHALGQIEEHTYTNSLEAFLYNYELGHRFFEVDFSLTSPENIMVAAHDEDSWRSFTGKDTLPELNRRFTYENFMNSKIFEKYTPLDCEDVIDLMIEYPDIYIITDTKLSDKSSVDLQFSQLVHCAMRKDPAVLDRIIPQIYTVPMLAWVMDIYPFKSAIFTLYQTDWTLNSLTYFCQKTNLRFITLPPYAATSNVIDYLNNLGIFVAAYTYNEEEEVKNLLDMGVDFIYTDFLTPQDLSNITEQK